MLAEFSGRPVDEADDRDYGSDLKECSVLTEFDNGPDRHPNPSLSVRYLLTESPGGPQSSIESTQWHYDQRQPDKSIIVHSLEVGDEARSWIEQGKYTRAEVVVRDETLLVEVSLLTTPGTTDATALETFARRIAGIALAAAH